LENPECLFSIKSGMIVNGVMSNESWINQRVLVRGDERDVNVV